MAGPGGREAGRLTIKVAPDTSGFARDLQSYLDRIESRAKVQVQVKPDMDGFAAELRTKLARIRATLKVKVEPDTQRFGSDLQNRLSSGQVRMPVQLELGAGEIARIRAELASIRPVPAIRVRLEPDRNGLANASGLMGRLGAMAGNAARGVAGLAATVGKLTVVASAIPAVAALTSGLVQMGPAAAVAAPALLMAASAGAALKIGMSGLGDALAGDADAMKDLAPSARSFVKEVRALGPAWEKVQQSVQGALFDKLGTSLKTTAKSVLPVLKTQLTSTATALNGMGKEVLTTATGLSESGALGKALSGANKGLTNLSGLPATMLQGLVQLSAAAAPVFEKMTASMGKGLDSLSKRMTESFKSGAMQAAIEKAVGMVKAFAKTVGDIGATLGNIFGPAAEAGAGFLPILAKVAAMAKEVTASPQAQATFEALFTTLAAIGQAVGGILGSALRAVMPILNTMVTTLAGPIQAAVSTLAPVIMQLVAAIGNALHPVVATLSRVLASLLPIISQVIAQIAGALGPVLELVGGLVAQLVTALASALAPILAQIPTLLAPILSLFTTLAPILGTIVSALMVALAPALETIGAAIGELMVALAPLIEAIGEILVQAFNALMPVIQGVMPIIQAIANVLSGVLASAITNVVVPAINVITSLLRGDFRGALDAAKSLLTGLGRHFATMFSLIGNLVMAGVRKVIDLFQQMGTRAMSAVTSMATRIVSSVTSGMGKMSSAISSGVAKAVGFVKDLPSKAKSALGDLGGLLKSAGRDLIKGFINGITGMVGSLKDKLSSITNMLPDWKGPATLDARILTPNGELLLGGFIKGIENRVPALKSALGGVTSSLPTLMGTASVVGQFNADPSGLQPGDRIVLSPDGRQQFDAYVDRLADQRIRTGLAGPAALGRK